MDTQDVVEELVLKKGLKVRREMKDHNSTTGVAVYVLRQGTKFGFNGMTEISILWEGTTVQLKLIVNSFARHRLTVDLHEPDSISRMEQFLDEFSCLI